MRVVINACYGGFSLSLAGERAYLARKGKQAFFYTNDRGDNQRIDFDSYVRAVEGERHFTTFTFTSDKGDTPTKDELWGEGNDRDKDYFNDRDVARNDPDLVAVVEELGHEADGDCARLAIVEIPDDVEWGIEEYDGLEHVAEKHRTWS